MGTRKPMLRERSHVEHPLWRKKVDFSLFGHRTHGGTTIPHWLWSMWHIEDLFGLLGLSLHTLQRQVKALSLRYVFGL